MKNNKGITMVMLVVTIIIMLILAGVLVVYSTDIIKSAKQQSISTNLLLIQAKIKTIAEKADFGEGELVGTQVQDEELINKLGLSEVEDKENIKQLSIEDLDNMGLNIDHKQKYVVYYTDLEIFYTEGLKDSEGKICYSESEITNMTVGE